MSAAANFLLLEAVRLDNFPVPIGEKNSWFGVPVGFSDLEDFGRSAAGEGSVKA
jgi:hypothetical protein